MIYSSKLRNISKVFVVALLLVVALTSLRANKALGAVTAEKGNITWEITGQTLYIKPVSGTDGAMANYYYMGSDTPWWNKDYNAVVIENGVTYIGSGAFYNSKAKSVVMSDTVTSIGAAAFYQANLIESINIPNSVEIIGEKAFYRCGKYSDKLTIDFDCINMPLIMNNAFDGIGGSDIPAIMNVKSVDVYLQLSGVVGCRFNINGDNRFVTDGNIKWGVIDNALHIKPVDGTDGSMKNYEYGGPWKKLNVTGIVIENGVTSIGDEAFYDFGAKEAVIADTVTYIGTEAFCGNHLLEQINIPNSVEKIGDYAFAYRDKKSVMLTINFDCLTMPKMGNRIFFEGLSYAQPITINVMSPYIREGVASCITNDDVKTTINIIGITNISDTVVAELTAKEYTGEEIKPNITVMHKTYMLELEQDCKISYENNIYAGKATVTITGIGYYKGTITKTFDILPVLDQDNITLYQHSSETIKLSGAKDTVTWKSANKAIATVDSKGKVTGVKPGSTTIAVSVNGVKATCNITVEGLNISESSLSMYTSDKQTLKVIGAKGKITWKTSNKSVASVNSSGVVTGIKAGTAIITASYQKKAYTCKVTVTKRPIILINYAYWTIDMFDGVEPTISLKNTSLKTIKYVYLETSFYNTVGDPAYCEINDIYQNTLQITGPIKQGANYSASWDAVIYNSAMGCMDINNIRVVFMDGSESTIKLNKSYY